MTANRHSFNSVSRFFPALQGIITANADPNTSVIELNPKALGLNPYTCAARLRDAIQAVNSNIVVPPFDSNEFHIASLEWIVTHNDTHVHLVHKERRAAQMAALNVSKLEVELKGETVLKKMTGKQLECLARLLGDKVLEGEYRFTPDFNPDSGVLQLIKESFDITFIDNNDGTFTIV